MRYYGANFFLGVLLLALWLHLLSCYLFVLVDQLHTPMHDSSPDKFFVVLFLFGVRFYTQKQDYEKGRNTVLFLPRRLRSQISWWSRHELKRLLEVGKFLGSLLCFKFFLDDFV